jgi:nucleoid-associated protein YgaU
MPKVDWNLENLRGRNAWECYRFRLQHLLVPSISPQDSLVPVSTLWFVSYIGHEYTTNIQRSRVEAEKAKVEAEKAKAEAEAEKVRAEAEKKSLAEAENAKADAVKKSIVSSIFQEALQKQLEKCKKDIPERAFMFCILRTCKPHDYCAERFDPLNPF